MLWVFICETIPFNTEMGKIEKAALKLLVEWFDPLKSVSVHNCWENFLFSLGKWDTNANRLAEILITCAGKFWRNM